MIILTAPGIAWCLARDNSDVPGGSTLGNIFTSHVSMNTVDIGLPQLAMHSPYETAGVKDTEYLDPGSQNFLSGKCAVHRWTGGDHSLRNGL